MQMKIQFGFRNTKNVKVITHPLRCFFIAMKGDFKWQ